jgi:hypothetical protein
MKESHTLFYSNESIAYYYNVYCEENWNAYSKKWHKAYGPKKTYTRSLQLFKNIELIETIPVKSKTQAISIIKRKVNKKLIRYGDIIETHDNPDRLIPIEDLILLTHKFPKRPKFFELLTP